MGSSSEDNSDYGAIRDAFRDAEAVRPKLLARTTKDVQQTGGKQTMKDLQEFTKHGLIGLLVHMLIDQTVDQTEIEHLLRYDTVKHWLEEVCLKHLIFSLFLTRHEAIVKILQEGLSRLFGEKYITMINAQALKLAKKYAKLSTQEQRNPNNAALQNRKTEIIHLSLSASEDLERYRTRIHSWDSHLHS